MFVDAIVVTVFIAIIELVPLEEWIQLLPSHLSL
jgi:hypothetical protein